MFFSIWRVKKPYGSLNCCEEGREKRVSMPCDCFLLFSAVEHVFRDLSSVFGDGWAGRGCFFFDFQPLDRPDGAAPLR